jgi:hypothetical protein
MSNETIQKTMQLAKDFAARHAGELAREIAEWQDTGELGWGRLRGLAALLIFAADHEKLRIAEALAHRAILDELIKFYDMVEGR